jgi:hypothetical protein
MTQIFDVYQYCEILAQSDRLSDKVIGWSGRWSILGSFLICSQCLATQQIDDSSEAFIHLPGCGAASRIDHPWHELMGLLAGLPAQNLHQ